MILIKKGKESALVCKPILHVYINQGWSIIDDKVPNAISFNSKYIKNKSCKEIISELDARIKKRTKEIIEVRKAITFVEELLDKHNLMIED